MTLRILVLLPLVLASCASWRGTDAATAAADMSLATSYWFRGVPQSTKPVLQADTVISIPMREGTFDFTTWGNIDIGSDRGDGILSDGNGGQFSEIDLVASHSRTIGAYDVSAGVISYNFPNQVGFSTHEAYVTVSRDAWNLGHTLSFYYDFDEAKDFYLSYQVLRSMDLQEGWTLDLSAMLGLISKDQAELYFGEDDAGFSDLSVTATVSRPIDDASSIFFSLSAVTVPDSSLQDALDDNDLDDTGLWLTAGASWSL